MQCPSCRKIIKNDNANFCNHCGCSIKGLLRSGTLLQGRYKITKVLGGGAMGWVYLAHDDKGVRRAVKEMKLGAYTSQAELADALRLFRSEAEFLAKLRHPGLPLLVDVFDLNGKPYMVMEFITGDTLEDVLVKNPGILTENQVMSWAEQLCEILAYLHEQKPNPIIHRDLKPSNIKLTANGVVRLLDFGIARSYKPGKIRDTISIGTARYCPIEQYGTAQTDCRSDIYALGATLYELLTKQAPPESTSRLTKNIPLPPIKTRNPQVSASAEGIILKALGLRPEERWQSAKEMQAAIRGAFPSLRAPIYSNVPSPPDASTNVGVVIKDADSALEHNKRGLNFSQSGQDAQAAVEYEKATQLDPTNSAYWYNLAGAYLSLKRYTEAIAACQKAVALLSTDADYYNRLARIHYYMGSHSDALVAIQRAIKLSPDTAHHPWCLGWIYEGMKRYAEAIATYQAALRLMPNDAAGQMQIYKDIGDAYYAQKDYKNSESAYRQAISVAEFARIRAIRQDSDSSDANLYNRLGNVYYAQNRFHEAAQAYQQAINKDANVALYHENLGHAYMRLGQNHDAVNAFVRASQLNPNNADIYHKLATVYFNFGHLSAALTAQMRAFSLEPTNANYCHDLGLIYEALGQKEEAMKRYRQALSLDVTLTKAQERLRELSKQTFL
jgi:serine/threonine-protein kinase